MNSHLASGPSDSQCKLVSDGLAECQGECQLLVAAQILGYDAGYACPYSGGLSSAEEQEFLGVYLASVVRHITADHGSSDDVFVERRRIPR